MLPLNLCVIVAQHDDLDRIERLSNFGMVATFSNNWGIQLNFVASLPRKEQFVLKEKLPAEAFSCVTIVSLNAEVVEPDWVALSLLLVTTSSLAMQAVNERSVSWK